MGAAKEAYMHCGVPSWSIQYHAFIMEIPKRDDIYLNDCIVSNGDPTERISTFEDVEEWRCEAI